MPLTTQEDSSKTQTAHRSIPKEAQVENNLVLLLEELEQEISPIYPHNRNFITWRASLKELAQNLAQDIEKYNINPDGLLALQTKGLLVEFKNLVQYIEQQFNPLDSRQETQRRHIAYLQSFNERIQPYIVDQNKEKIATIAKVILLSLTLLSIAACVIAGGLLGGPIGAAIGALAGTGIAVAVGTGTVCTPLSFFKTPTGRVAESVVTNTKDLMNEPANT